MLIEGVEYRLVRFEQYRQIKGFPKSDSSPDWCGACEIDKNKYHANGRCAIHAGKVDGVNCCGGTLLKATPENVAALVSARLME